jgi:hypothetical protein
MRSLLFVIFSVCFSIAVNAQESKKQDSSKTNRAVMQDGHSATGTENKAVMQDGNSVKSGENKAVMQDGNSAAKSADHKCNEKCKDGKHNCVHGEKGHKCVEECKKKEHGKQPK